MHVAEELQKLEDLRRSGALSEAEFAQAKTLVLSGQPPRMAAPVPPPEPPRTKIEPPWGCLSGLVVLAVVAVIALATNPSEESLKNVLRRNRAAERAKGGVPELLIGAAADLAIDYSIERTSYGVFSVATVRPKVRLVGAPLSDGTQVIGCFGRWWLESKDTR